MKDPASQWDSPLDREAPAEPSAFFKSLTEADKKIADLADLRARLNDDQAQPEWKALAAGIALLVARYYDDAADAEQEAAITNLAGLLRHASAFSAALCREVEHYAADARDARDEVRALRDQLADLS